MRRKERGERMDRNICKMILTEESERLLLRQFVYEQNPVALEEECRLSSYRVYLAVAGSGNLRIRQTTYPIEAGTLYFCFPGDTVRVVDGARVEMIYITFDGGRVTDLFWRFGIHGEQKVFAGNHSLIPFWRESLVGASEQNIDLVSECVLLYTFSRLVRAEKNGDGVIRELIRYMEEHYSDIHLTLGSAAKQCGYHPKYLSHRFKECTGVGFQRYLRDLRIRNATFLFDHGLDSIKNVSLLCGFEDALYFSRVFKESVGMSPRDYLRRQRASDSEASDDMNRKTNENKGEESWIGRSFT